MDYILLGLSGIIVLICIISLFKKRRIDIDYNKLLYPLKEEINRLEKYSKDENSALRMEMNQSLKDNRQELNNQIEQFRRTIDLKFKEFSDTLKNSQENVLNKQNEIRQETEKKLETSTLSMSKSFEGLSLHLKNSLIEFGDLQKKNSEDYLKKHDDIKKTTEDKLELVRKSVEDKLSHLQTENSKKLEEMRMTVDQKLQEALDKKLSESFNTVSKQLQDVYTGLGEMKNLANDVGGLKKVLSNVKTRGIIGEIQLGSILESILNPDQFVYNTATKNNTQQRVEYAIKLPGKDDLQQFIYLPIDSKFPDSTYQKLLDAYDQADNKLIQETKKELEKVIKSFAKDIHDKYINPPFTTDFAIMFLPFEGLYAEVLQNPDLIRSLQDDYRINIAGPTTLGAFINSLQMGFKTLAIEKRSSEVWRLLESVKQEFNKFGEVLVKAQKKLKGASEEIDLLVGVKTRKIQSALKNVQTLSDQTHQNQIDQFEEEEDNQE